jgi:hypothetical protein
MICLCMFTASAASGAQGRPYVEPPPGGLSTPELIEAALSSGEIDRDTANLYLAYALTEYELLPLQYHSDVRWHGTPYVLQLREELRTRTAGPARARIESLLASTCSDSIGSLPHAHNSPHFHIQHDTIGGGLSIADYANALETSWTTEIDTFGWAAPPALPASPPPGNRYHVRIDNLGGGLVGYVDWVGTHAGFVGDNPNTLWDDGDAWASCMVLNRSIGELRLLQATAAHELNHAIQFGLGSLVGTTTSFVEGGAVWMEDEVFDASNDNYQFLWPPFETCLPLVGKDYVPLRDSYSAWIVLRGMTERYGTGVAGGGEGVMQDFWEATSRGLGNNLSAMNLALVNRGTTLADAYHAYAIAVKFNRPCGGAYAYPYCFEEGPGYVSAKGATAVHGSISAAGSNYSGTIQDNYALNWVSLPKSGGPYAVTLRNMSGGGQLRASLVCDTGSALQIHALPSVVGPGGSSALTDFNPAGCSQVVAVITNQSQTADNPAYCESRSYTLQTNGGTGPTPRAYLPLVVRMPPPLEIPLDAAEAWVSSGRAVCLTTQWYADTPAYVQDYIAALELTVTLDGGTLPAVSDYWGGIAPCGDIDGDGDVDYVARWRYPLGALSGGDHTVASDFNLSYPLTDGFDWDGDGELDVFSGSWHHALVIHADG